MELIFFFHKNQQHYIIKLDAQKAYSAVEAAQVTIHLQIIKMIFSVIVAKKLNCNSTETQSTSPPRQSTLHHLTRLLYTQIHMSQTKRVS